MSKVEKYFRLAAQVAEHGDELRQYRLGAVGIRNDGVIVTSSNTRCRSPQKRAHAEARLVRKLNRDSVVFVVRILRNGALANAKPCPDCQKALRGRGIKKVYYSIGTCHYGVLILNE